MKKENISKKIGANELSKETKRSMRTRIIAGIVGIIIVVPLIILGDYFFAALLAFLVVVGVIEIIKCTRKKQNIALYILAIIYALAVTFWPAITSLIKSVMYTGGLYTPLSDETVVLLQNWRLFESYKSTIESAASLEGLSIPVSIIVLSILSLFITVVFVPEFEVRDACFLFTMIFLIAIGGQAFLYLRIMPVSYIHYVAETNPTFAPLAYFNRYDNLQTSLLFFYVILGTFVTDIGAYFVGVLFGKHKMNERISPKKTWEGFFGGIIISAIVSFLFAFIFALNGINLSPKLDASHWYIILAISLVMPFISVLGDFVFSSIKRFYGIKDFGRILPGHGGVLDRIDSLLCSSIVVALILSLIIYWFPL